MIICIIIFSILMLGILAFVFQKICNNLYYKWDVEKNKYAPETKEFIWTNFGFQYKKNPNYNEKLYKKASKKRKFYANINDNILYGIGIVGCLLGGLGTMICSIAALSVNVGQSPKIEYLNMIETRSAYVRELENNPENEHLYQSIADFNNSLRKTKMGYENPWFNWFNNPLIANNINYIEVK